MTVGIAILDMDGTILSRRSIDSFCDGFGFTEKLVEVDRQSSNLPAYMVSEAIARFFSGLPKHSLEQMSDTIPLNDGINDLVSFLKSNEFHIAIATDSYQFLAERLAKRIGADSCYGNLVELQDGVLTGRLLTDHHCLKLEGCREYSACKLWFLRQMKAKIGGVTVAVGDGDSDLCMIKGADLGIAYRPKSKSITKVAHLVAQDFSEAIDFLKIELSSRERRSDSSPGASFGHHRS